MGYTGAEQSRKYCWGKKRELADNTGLAKQAFAISLLTLRLLSTRAIISNSNCLTIVLL